MKHLYLPLLVAVFLAPVCFPQVSQQHFADLGDFKLENGDTILDCRIGYRTLGQLNSNRSNIVVMSTWFTGRTADLDQLLGPGKLIDTSKYYVIAIDALGNGISSSPSNSKRQPRMNFPSFSIGDIVNSEHALLTNVLKIQHVKAIVGSSSIGGQVTLEWMVSYPDFMDEAIPISASPRLTAYDLLFREALRDAVVSDPTWNHGNYTAQPGTRHVAELASLIDITPEMYNESHMREDVPKAIGEMSAAIAQFDANDLLRQLEAMSSHDISRRFGGSMDRATAAVKSKTLVIVSANERIVNPMPVIAFAKSINARILELQNKCGQVLSPCDADKVNSAVAAFLEE